MEFIFTLELVTTWALVGLIWLVQLVHYPTFQWVAAAEFSDFHKMHSRQITWIVLPLMTGELALSSWRVFGHTMEWGSFLAWLLVLGIWVSTFLVQVPLHEKLGLGKNDHLVQQLIRTNWWRTVAWTTRGILLLFL